MAVEQIQMFTMAVTDMAQAKAFYADTLGFQVTRDYGQDDQHRMSLDAPGGGASLNLTTMHENMKPGTMKLYLSTPDVEAAYKELQAKGIEREHGFGDYTRVDLLRLSITLISILSLLSIFLLGASSF